MASNSKWSGGINNRANFREMPDGFVRDLVNLDPLVGGVLGLRSGFTQVSAATQGRGALAIGSKILFADGESLICFDTQTNASHTLADIAGAGRFVGVVHNSELFFCTANQSFRFDGSVLRPWGVPTVFSQPVPTITGGGLSVGTYQAAVTIVNAQGEEGGTTSPIQITVQDGQGLAFAPPGLAPGEKYRLYVSPNAAETLYLQYEGTEAYTVTTLRDDTARLDNLNLIAPQGGDQIATFNGLILLADGDILWHTLPFRPHLLDRSNSFFQYSAPITVVVPVQTGVFVCADKTYFLTAAGTDQLSQTKCADYGAVAGTAAVLPDGRAMWMTPYGLAIGAIDGSVTLVSAANFVPQLAQEGASGVIDHNGNQMVITTMAGPRGPNPLAASDYYEAEIITPCP